MSVCSKCLPEKLPIDGKKQSVCRKCYNKAAAIEDEVPQLLPPEALKRYCRTHTAYAALSCVEVDGHRVSPSAEHALMFCTLLLCIYFITV